MSPMFRGIVRWGPIVLLIVICCLLLQEVWSRPRLRHSHRKLRCSKCPPGWGVYRKCTELTDTACTPCEPGSYSPHHSYHTPCWVCSRCGPGLFEAHPCHPAGDTVCDDCNRSGVVPNSDFLFKCRQNVTEDDFIRGKVRWTQAANRL
ncbi:tumor necrosis factor receptor superfamily member 14-like [Periplaneta americana]|uniref:tumor necrosis factor receptor superfamily member 14-like n=1 Tax=Periplaneta americana TaxID=6978 RepID=UPI0037E9C207